MHIRTIDSLHGIPGYSACHDTAAGDLLRVVRRLDYEAFSDAALSELVSLQIERDDRRGL